MQKNITEKSRLLFFIGEDSTFYTHRINLAKAALKEGYQVAIATRCNKYQSIIENAGIQVFPLKKFQRSSINPWGQIQSLLELNTIYKQYQPNIVHHVAMKPVIFGTIIARFNKVPKIINALGGLGYIFTDSVETTDSTESIKSKRSHLIQFLKKIKKTILRTGVLKLFQWIFSHPNTKLILQNTDDIQTLLSSHCITENKITLIRGAGVDIQAFPAHPPMPQLSPNSPIIITCVSRLLWDKGIGDLVEAAKIMRDHDIPAKVILYGEPDLENPTAIPLHTLQTWHNANIIEWRGHCEQVAQAYAECHIAVLPSFYREGLPKTLLEAASSARPIVTTDATGCREVVEDQINGILIPVKNVEALVEALVKLCQDEPLRNKMGAAGRERVEKYFSDTLIHQQTLALYQ